MSKILIYFEGKYHSSKQFIIFHYNLLNTMRKHVKSFLVLLCLVLVNAGLSAQGFDPNQAIPFNSQVKVGKLENGLTYYIQKNPKPEKRVELRLAINAGSMQEDDDQLGLAHFTEHMLFNGTKNFAKNNIVKYLQSVGVKFGADLNAYTSFDETVYMLPIPADNPEILEKGFQILEDWAHLATFDNTEIDKERGVVIEEWRTGRGAGQRMRDQYFPKLLKGSRYAERLPIGELEILQKFEYETIKRFYRDWYRPDLMAVVVVGDIDIAEMEQKIKSHFGNLKPVANPRPKKLYEIPNHAETLISVATDKEAPFTQVQVYYKQPKKEMKTVGDYRESLAADLYSEMLNSRFEELTQAANPPFNSAFGGYGGLLRTKDSYFTSASVDEKSILSGLKAALTENKRVLQHGFNESELERAKTAVLTRYERQYNERNKTESGNLVMRYVSYFLEGSPEPGIEWEFDMVKKLLPTIKVEDINAMPKKWITKENRVVIITAPEKEGLKVPTEAEVAKVLAEVEEMSVEPYEDKVIDEPLMVETPTPGKVQAEKQLSAVGATEIVLSNGVKVILKPTDFKDDEILMTAFSMGGHSLVADNDYYSATNASDIVNESGLRDFSSTDLQKLLTGKVVNVNPFIGELSEGFSGSASPKDFETMLQLVNLYFTMPRQDKTAFESYVNKQKSFLQNLGKSPQFAFFDKQFSILTQNNPRGGGIPKPEDFDKIDLDRAYAIYKDRFADASDFTFVMVGNFETEKIKPLLETYLGSLPALNRKETFRDLGIRPPSGMVQETFEKGADPKSQVLISFTGTFKNKEERYLMRSLAEVLTIKLIENLREEKGGVYGTRANASTSIFPYQNYNMSVNFTCAPENVQELMAAVYEEIEKIQKNGPLAEDLNKVKEAQRKDVEKNEKENRFWLNGLRTAYYEGSSVENLTANAQMQRIDKLSAKSLQKTAKKYLKKDKHITLVMNPEEKKEEVKNEADGAKGAQVNTTELMKNMTAEKVISKAIEAQGGKAKLEAVKTIRHQVKGEITSMGLGFDMNMAQEEPNKMFMKQDIMGQSIVIISNGEKAKMSSPQGEQILEGDDAKAYSGEPIFPDLNYLDASKFKLSLEDVEDLEGTPAYRISVENLATKTTTTRWYSAESGLPLKSDDANSTNKIIEYVTIDGIQYPKVIISKNKLQRLDIKMDYEKTEFNVTLEADLFKIEE